jgi:hypothetical protein
LKKIFGFRNMQEKLENYLPVAGSMASYNETLLCTLFCTLFINCPEAISSIMSIWEKISISKCEYVKNFAI